MAFLTPHVLLLAASFVLFTAPVEARRTAVDEIPNPDDPEGPGTPTQTTLSGYCDLQGDECGPDDGKTLGYGVSFDGGTTFLTKAYVHGNGLLTFGSAVDFANTFVSNGMSLQQYIGEGNNPALTEYDRTLVSAGQNNWTDFDAFMQSAELSIDDGTIKATWFTCFSPLNCRTNPYTLTLTPTTRGYRGVINLSQGGGDGDLGYVIGGVYTSTGATFDIAATFDGLTPSAAVPEPATWAMMIVGFGLIGGAMRRRATPARQTAR